MHDDQLDPVEAALATLAHGDPARRKAAAQSLLYRRPINASHRIQRLFARESDPVVSKWLGLLIARLGDATAIPVLEAKLKATENGDTRDWLLVSTRLLRKVGCQEEVNRLLASSSPTGSADAAVLMWENPEVSKEQIDQLVRLDALDDPRARRWRLLALGTQHLTDYAPLHLALQDDDYRVREYAAWAIAQHRDASALPALIYRLADEHARVREWALKAIAVLQHPESMSLLLQHYPHEADVDCRDGIIRALAPYAARPQVKQFVLQLLNSEQDTLLLTALFTLVARSDALRDDPDILSAAITRATTSSDHLLVGGLKAELYTAVPEPARTALDAVMADPTLARISSFIGASVSSGNAQAPSVASRTRPVLAVLIALSEELAYFQEALAPAQMRALEEYPFPVYHLSLPVGTPTVLADCYVSTTDQAGPERAALRAKDLIDTFAPDALVNLGIAGALSDELCLGDVVIGTQLENYMHDVKALNTKANEGFSLSQSHDSFKSDYNLAVRAGHLRFSSPDDYAEWQNAAQALLPATQDINRLRDQEVLRAQPIVLAGHIASGPAVAAGDEFAAWLLAGDRKYAAIDMEAAGMALAEHLAPTGARVLVLRGISDFADHRKKRLDRIGGGVLRRLAMVSAARYFRLFLARARSEWLLRR